MKKTVSVVLLLVFMTLLVGCNKQQPDGGEMSSNPTESADNSMSEDNEESMQYVVCVDWMDFIKLDGVSYIGDWRVTEVSAELIGEKIGEVTCGVPTVYTDGTGNTTSMEPEDGAAFICGVGTELFSVIGNDNVVAALIDGKYYLYVSRNHSAGFVGEKLYAIVNGQLFVYEQYQPGTGDLTKNSVLGSFETETEIEGIVWDVFSTEEYPDLSFVLLISGTNVSWTYSSDK